LPREKLLTGAIVGAAGGAAADRFIDLGVDDSFLREVGESLKCGSSAIVAIIDFDRVDVAMAELDRYEGGRILRHIPSPEVYRKLSKAVED
jgi:uncharacterized membrane protein